MSYTQARVLFYFDVNDKLKIVDRAHILNSLVPFKVSLNCDKLIFEKAEMDITTDRGLFISDINDPLFSEIVKANFVYQGVGAVVMGLEKVGRLADLDYSFIQIDMEFPQYSGRFGIYMQDLTPKQETLMMMLETRTVYRPEYRDFDDVYKSFKNATADAFLALHHSLEGKQLDLFRRAVCSMTALIEATSFYEMQLGNKDGIDNFVSSIMADLEIKIGGIENEH